MVSDRSNKTKWGIIAAAGLAIVSIAFGLGIYIASLNQSNEQRYQSYESSQKVKNRATATVSNVAASLVERTPCNNPKSESESDLCAQWRAAKAAEKSADWTKFSVVASIIGISLLLWQIILTREAVRDTHEATDAMHEANKIAKNSKRPRLQIEVVPTDDLKIVDNEIVLNYKVVVINVGEEIADIVKIQTRHMNGVDEVHNEVASVFDQPWKGERVLEKLGKNMSYSQPSCWKLALSEMRDVRLQERAIFIPAILVDVRYCWSDTETVFQTARACLVMCNQDDVKATVVWLDKLPIARANLRSMSHPGSARMT